MHVRLRIGPEAYAMPVEDVLEVAELGEIAPVPGAPRAVLGVRNLRGEILPVIDLGLVLGVGGAGDLRRLLVAETQGRRAGFAVDDVEDIADLPEVERAADSDLLAGTALVGGDLVGLLDVARLFDALDGDRSS